MQRRVEEPDRHGQSSHGGEDPFEVLLLVRQELLERSPPLVLRRGEDHRADEREPFLGHEHVLGPAKPDALRAELARLGSVLGRVRIGAHPHAPQLVGPAEQGLEVLVDLGRDERDVPDDHVAGAAIDRDDVALRQLALAQADLPGAEVDRERVASRHARLAHPARDDGRVRGHPAVGREHPSRLDDAVDVVGRRLGAHEDDVLPGLALFLRPVGVQDDLPGGGAGRGVEPLRGRFVVGLRVDHRVEELVELARVDARDGLLLGDQAVSDHLHDDAQRGDGRALAGPRLEEVQGALLDRELDVLHLPVVLLEPRHRVGELAEGLREARLHALDGLGRPDPGDDVLALRVHEELAPHPLLAGRGVASERHARARVVALVAEDHLDDVDRRSQVIRDLVRAAVDLRARRVPGVEDRANRARELLPRVLRERLARALRVDRREAFRQLAQVGGVELDILGDAAFVLQGCELPLEELAVDVVDDVPEHLDEPAVRVEGKALVVGRLGKPLDGVVVQAKVQDRVHHPGHRDRRSRADGHEQRVGRVAETLPRRLLELLDVLLDLLPEAVGQPAAEIHVLAAGLGRHGEAGRDREPDRGHLGQADALAAEQLTAELAAFREVVNVRPRHRPDRQFSHRAASHARRGLDAPDPPAGEWRRSRSSIIVG